MNQSFMFRLPTEIHFGAGVAGSLLERLRARRLARPFVVTDPGIRQAGIVASVIQPLIAAGMAPEVFDGISPNPRDHECVVAAEQARQHGADVVVAIGGGSPIDAAKAAAGLATNGGAARDWEAPRTFDRPPLPLVAIPTTAGTGSEVTRSAVITDSERKFKMSLRDIRLAPVVALVDPLLTYSVPPSVTAATGMDVLTHAVEAYTCRVANPISDTLALRAIRLVADHLTHAVQDGSDAEARSGMMLASLLAGMAFFNADVAAVHCLAEALGGRYDTPHGTANAIFLPYVYSYNADADPDRHAAVAAALGVEIENLTQHDLPAEGGSQLKALNAAVGIPRFADLPGVDPADFPAIAEAAEQNLSNRSNARSMGRADYEEILRQAWED